MESNEKKSKSNNPKIHLKSEVGQRSARLGVSYFELTYRELTVCSMFLRGGFEGMSRDFKLKGFQLKKNINNGKITSAFQFIYKNPFSPFHFFFLLPMTLNKTCSGYPLIRGRRLL